MRVLIADDEPIARQILAELLEGLPGVEVAGEAQSGTQALELIAQHQPDVVLLDLEMPDIDGFSVARSLRGGEPAVIFVTAYSHRAVDAFELGAADYLLKPVRRERLEAALRKVKPRPSSSRVSTLRRITGRKGRDLHVLDLGDVIAMQADGELVHILTTGGRYRADQTMKALDEKLPHPPFRRIHRGTIINTDHIRRISPLSSKRWLLQMSGSIEVVVSKRMAGAIRDPSQW
jgi:two-component system, LytTR family, response regulator AlgR